MPIFKFKGPDGKIHRIRAPEGTTDAEAFEQMQRGGFLTQFLESPVGRFAEGVAQPFVELEAGITPSSAYPVPGARERILERVRQPGGLPKTLGRVAGEIGLAAGPASAAYRGTRALTGQVPFFRHSLPLAAESATVGGLEAAKAPEEGQTRLERGATAAGLNFGIGAGLGALNRAWSPRLFPKSAEAVREETAQRAMGVEPRLPLAMAAEPTGPVGRVTQWFHRQPLRALPGVGATLRRQTDEALDDWRETLFQRALPERARGRVAMPRQREGAEAPFQDTFKDINDWYKMEYGEILDPFNFKLNRGPNADRLAAAYEGIPVEGARREVTEKLGDYLQNLADESGALSGSAISSLKTRIRNAMRLADDADVKQGWTDVLESIDDIVEGSLRQIDPEYATRYQALREPYRNLVTLEKAASRQGGKYAEFSPDDVYAASIGKGKRETGERMVAQGRAPLQAEAQRMARLMEPLPKKQQESNIFQLGALAGATGIGGYAAPLTTGAIWSGIAGSLPRQSQRYLMSELPWQQPAQTLRYSPYAQEIARALRIGGATGGS